MGSLPDVTTKPKTIKPACPREECIQRSLASMKNSNQPLRKLYTEEQAAEALGISLLHLRALLDENVFNDGEPRPDEVLLEASDLVLLDFWRQRAPTLKVIRMPRRPR